MSKQQKEVQGHKPKGFTPSLKPRATTSQPQKHKLPIQPDWVGEESKVYFDSHLYLPKIKEVNHFHTGAESVLSATNSGIKYLKVASSLVAPALVASGLPAGAAFIGSVVTVGAAISPILDSLINGIQTKNKIIDAINEEIENFNEKWHKVLVAPKKEYVKALNKAFEENKNDLGSKKYKDAITKASEDYFTQVTKAYNAGLKDMNKSICAKLEAMKLPHSELLPQIKKILDMAITLTSSSTDEYLKHSVEDVLRLEQKKIQLATRARAILSEYKLLDEDGKVNTVALQKCDKREITILMMATTEAQLEKSQHIPKDSRKFSAFDDMPKASELEKTRKAKAVDGFALGSGPFQDVLKTHNPKAMARMLSYTQGGNVVKDKINHKTEINDSINLLDAVPYESWSDIEKLGNACRKRECCGIVVRSLLGAANKVANILNNIIGRGVKDQALEAAAKDFSAKMHKQEGSPTQPLAPKIKGRSSSASLSH
ncbi:MAG: hypothetical protein V4485_02445 [Pseudomonadota bacterium]